MLAMLEDVLAALAATPGLAGHGGRDRGPAAARLASRYGARVIETGPATGIPERSRRQRGSSPQRARPAC